MRLVAALPWYDEPVAYLDRCVRSLAGVVDHLIALDGRWDHFDTGAPILSHWTQANAIATAADAIGLDHHVWMGPTIWSSQVAKRASLMELASEQGDWVLVIDADEYVVSSLPDELDEALERTTLHVATVTCSSPGPRGVPSRIRRLFRAGTTVVTAHNGYRYGDQWSHGDSAKVKLAPFLDTGAYLEIHDVSSIRDPARMEKKREYQAIRRTRKLEAWT